MPLRHDAGVFRMDMAFICHIRPFSYAQTWNLSTFEPVNGYTNLFVDHLIILTQRTEIV